MALKKVDFAPGFNKQSVPSALPGKWVDGDFVRFRYTAPEKIGDYSLSEEYGTENFCFLLYSLIKMQRPKNVIELGCGHGCVSTIIGQALKETKIRRVQALVLIGDAFEEDIDLICHYAGKLGALGVRTFCFQEGNDPIAKSGFQQIARLTNGAYSAFDSDSVNQLKELLKAVAVYAAGGLKKLEAYSKINTGAALKLTNQIKK